MLWKTNPIQKRFLQSSATPVLQKRRRRCALPAHSVTRSERLKARGISTDVLDCGGKQSATPLLHSMTRLQV
jgi:hypothetical protein